jgi:hypothetical protein
MAVSRLLPDGRWEHTFRQSGIKTSTICLERARREWTKTMPEIETDAACVGTACHAVFETNMLAYRDSGEHYDQETCVEMFLREYEILESAPNFQYVKYTPAQAREFGKTCVRTWYQEVRPSLDPLHVELNFEVPLHEDDERVINLSGTIDLVDRRHGLCDYKTSGGGKYQEWQYERWAIQPTAYTYAAHMLGLDEYANAFEYIVLSKDGVQRFGVERSPRHWEWMRAQCASLAVLIEAGLQKWPTNDTHALCSEKWCPAWFDCKGLHLTINPKGSR